MRKKMITGKNVNINGNYRLDNYRDPEQTTTPLKREAIAAGSVLLRSIQITLCEIR